MEHMFYFRKQGNRNNGLTLIELMVGVAVLTIIWLFALPSLRNMVMNNRLLAQADAFVNTLNYARNIALNQNISVIVCPVSTPSSTACGTSWSSGYIVVSQPASGSNQLLNAYVSTTNSAVLSAVAISGTAASSVNFDARGLATTQANFKLCDSRGSTFARSIQVSPTGFVQSSSRPGIAVWSGGGLTCP